MKAIRWIDVTIMEPCISWQTCQCGTSMLFVWDDGKVPKIVPMCDECDSATQIVSVITTTN